MANIEIRNALKQKRMYNYELAELLGIGNLIAHAETMTVTIDGKEVKGCFMEFAEGFDMGGGTDFTTAIEAFSLHVDNRIIFTDGKANMPETPLPMPASNFYKAFRSYYGKTPRDYITV